MCKYFDYCTLLQQCAMCKTANCGSVSFLLASINRVYRLTEKNNLLYLYSFLFSVETIMLTDDCHRHDKYWYIEGNKKNVKNYFIPFEYIYDIPCFET